MTTNEMITYDQIVELDIATPEEINLVRCCMNGTWDEVLKSILYARTGFRTIEQWLENEEEE